MKKKNARSTRTWLLKLGCVVLALGSFLGGVCRVASAQQPRIVRPEDYQRGTVPQEPEHRAAPARLPERDVEIADDTTILIDSLLGIRFVRTPEEVIKEGFKPGIEIKDIELLDNDEFRNIINPYLGKPVTMRSISIIIRDTIMYYRSKDRPVVDVFLPEQEITEGVVQLLVVEARVSDVRVEGLEHFSADLIRGYIRNQKGDVIRASELLEDIDYINTNPFRIARPVLEPGKEFGTTDIVVDSRDRFPMRFYAGYDDTGSRATGLERFFAGVNMGNLFGCGHEVGYQYTTNRHFSGFGIHSAYWRIPLPNRDTLAFFGNLADYEIDRSDSHQDSLNWMAHVRYITPLPSRENLRHGLEFGLDFRRADNDLQVGGSTIYDDYIDIAQFAFQYGGRAEDRLGDTSYVFNLYWSPFADFLSNHQNDEKYHAVRAGTDPRYLYAHVSVERLWVLPKNWSLFNRLTGQVANRRLPPTEQLGLGGYNTVRGFDERDVNSDNGIMATVELRTPQIDLGIVDKAKNIRSFLQFLTFCDYGYARNRGSAEFEHKTEDMLSVGVGLRCRISDNVHVRVDYGHKLMDVSASESGDGRFHIFLMFSY
ncbi:MAG: ShlB/FhaC/HecB family hemolysin secretion/activation protein [Planctomycetota bacterium]|jgi:hemolysin activation/secretion protein